MTYNAHATPPQKIFGATFASEIQQHDSLVDCLLLSGKNAVPLLAVVVITIVAPGVFSAASAIPPLLLSSLMAVPMISFAVAYTMLIQANEVPYSISLAAFVGSLLLILLAAWHRNRTHKDLILLHSHEQGIDLFTAVALCMSLQQSQAHSELLLPAMMGLTVVTLLCASMAATADVWYAIGSGQFWMISLDFTVAASFLVIAFSILGYRLVDRFGGATVAGLQMVTTGVADVDIPMTPMELALSSVLMWLGLASTLGIATIRAWSPFGAYFYGKVYCHGMQDSKQIAVCLPWSDRKEILPELAKMKANVNFLVSQQDLVDDAEVLKEASKAGHMIVPYTAEPNARATFEKVFGQPPEWAHGAAATPVILFWEGTRISMWTNRFKQSVNMAELKTDLAVMGGGAIVCLEQVPQVMDVLKEIVSYGYNLTTMTVAVPEPKKMVLAVDDDE